MREKACCKVSSELALEEIVHRLEEYLILLHNFAAKVLCCSIHSEILESSLSKPSVVLCNPDHILSLCIRDYDMASIGLSCFIMIAIACKCHLIHLSSFIGLHHVEP